MISVYIHIPFCVKKCAYCDFLSFPCEEEIRDKYVDSLCKEIADCDVNDKNVRTVFFGGGTPSILDAEKIGRILAVIKNKFNILPGCEISMECNPGTASYEKLQKLHEFGINRLSIGLQSCNNDELMALGRIHNYEKFLDTFDSARRAGFDNINIDLMSALPGQSYESYVDSLTKIVKMEPEHMSSYSLIIEENTPFWDIYGDDKGVAASFAPLPDEDTEREMYYATDKILSDAGYHRYEISNYAKEGYECEHNKVYWSGGDYISFGIGASSYIEGVRFNNITDVDEYIRCPGGHTDINRLTEVEKQEEYMFVGLRLTKGVSLTGFIDKFGVSVDEVYGPIINRFVSEGLLEYRKDMLRLTKWGIDVSNMVLAEFLQ